MVSLAVVAPAPSFAASSVPNTAQACLVGDPSTEPAMPAPFMKLPFRQADAAGSIFDTEAWFTSPDELAIDDEVNGDLHQANDFELVRTPDNGYGRPILAAFSGRAYYSYQYLSGAWTDPQGVVHQVGMGAGLVVEVRQQDQPGNPGWVAQYIHLSKVAQGIPYVGASKTEDMFGNLTDWSPSGILTDDDTLWSGGVPVVQGQVIGFQGDTGIGLDWKDDFNGKTGKVKSRDRQVLKPWDPPQLHFQIYQGRIQNAAGGWSKQHIVDPFGWYSQVCPGEWKPTTSSGGVVNPYTPQPGVVRTAAQSAWLTDASGRPKYAG